tara:strand:- start:111 stop:410 length:300 start_codon:yes stop_codon:yes gene_type:complete
MIQVATTFTLNPQTDERHGLTEVAKGFEAIFARHMLAAARQAGFGDTLFASQGSQTFRQMMDERFADILAERGSLGLATMIETQLASQIAPQVAAEMKK